MNDMTQDFVEPTIPGGPGRRLREARESKKISLEEAAIRLRLHERLVTAIESDDYDKLPPPAFVVGYLRNYARLLELPQEEILNSYAGYQEHKPQLVPRMRADREVRSSDLFVRLVTWFIILGLIALPALWWFSQRAEQAAAVAPGAIGSPAAPEAIQPGQPLFPLGGPAAAQPEAASPSEPASPGALPGEPPAPAVGAGPATGPAIAAVGGRAPLPLGEALTPLSQLNPTPAPVAPEAEPAQPPASLPVAEAPSSRPAAAASSAQLRLEFKADSWARVTDSTGKRLLADLVRSGNTRNLAGQPPYEITLGYAPGVEVFLGGDRFDHTPFNRKNIAKFTLGKSAPAEPPATASAEAPAME